MPKPKPEKLVISRDDAPHIFAHRVTRFLVDHGCLTITLATIREDEALTAAGRVTMPLAAAELLHRDLSRVLAATRASRTPDGKKGEPQ